jgi:chemotaxis protein MotB
MRTSAIVILVVILAAAFVSGIILYRRSHDAQAALQLREERIAELSAKLSKVREETATLRHQITELEDRVQGLHSAVRYLEEEVARSQSELEELQGARVRIPELQKQLRDAQSRERYLEEQLAEKHRELKGLDRTLRTLRGEKASAEASIERIEQEISVTFVDRILFEFGKAAVTPEGEEVLRQVGQILKGVEDRKIRVVGHTDERPIHPDYRSKFPSNWELSSARASAVIHYFQKELDLYPTRLEAVGRSFYDPIASNETAEGRAKNRRVEIIIAPQLE